MSGSQQITVGMHEVISRFPELVRLALEEDADIVITQRNKPVIRLVPYEEQPKGRGFGALRGRIEISDDFDSTPDDVINQFYGNSDQ
ncbi:type II toxin-antitoxin system Phd/YefM family antitoxin [Endozoicomonas sp. 2B-B]